MQEITFSLQGEAYIELYKLLKVTNIAPSGAIAKMMVEDGEVILNGQKEFRKRAKLRSGDKVKCLEYAVSLIS